MLRGEKGDAISRSEVQAATAESSFVFDEEDVLGIFPFGQAQMAGGKTRVCAYDASRNDARKGESVLLADLGVAESAGLCWEGE